MADSNSDKPDESEKRREPAVSEHNEQDCCRHSSRKPCAPKRERIRVLDIVGAGSAIATAIATILLVIATAALWKATDSLVAADKQKDLNEWRQIVVRETDRAQAEIESFPTTQPCE